ncbi:MULTISPECIES: RDD family protein [unclassified Coleofasciculus]|uniref:RDD family protein n=1 Tax=unclassified Coleofasciculus TaxID=2692782 RepID=UPI00187F3DBA|nr:MULTISPECIES: RDD family protein [unclassified Coleofasciculus]MBE9125890.1 RDD family protein [Coleofasciculus sp. LEGE 07081]MBE9149080.1 RDD family protein [Coleofasciculus sp. LEGE 07092]
MNSIEPLHKRFPKIPIERRAYAFLIDFVAVWLTSSFAGRYPLLQMVVFLLLWLAMRVILVSNNKGQSVGRWAMDIKVIDAKYSKIPGLVTLGKREGILGFCALLAMIGLNIGLANGISMLLLIAPLLADCGVAISDPDAQQAFHDRVAKTITIPTRRGFSLDLRVKRWVAQLRRRVQK